MGSTLRSSAVVLAHLAVSTAALGQEQPTAPTEGNAWVAEVPKASRSEGALGTALSLEDSPLDPEVIRLALERELRVAVSVNAPKAPLSIRVQGRSLTARFDRDDGRTVERRLELPEPPDQQVEIIALLCSNLVRDEAHELLATLRPPAPPPPSEPAAERSAAEPVVEAEPSRDDEKQASAVADDGKLAATATPADEATPHEKPATPEARETLPPLREPPVRFNLSLAHPISIYPDSHQREVNVELGLAYSRVGALNGFGANGIVARNDRGVRGFQVGGLWSWSRGDVRGVSASGMLATTEGNLHGGQTAGFASLTSGDIRGVQFGGSFSLAGDLFRDDVTAPKRGDVLGAQGAGFGVMALGQVEGFQAAGFGTFAGGSVTGFQAAGAANYAQGLVTGFQAAGAVNYSQGSVTGFQAAGAANLARGGFSGFQAAVANYAGGTSRGFQAGAANVGGELRGLQVGVINVGGHVTGTQIGLINVAREIDGAPVGLINVSPSIRTQALAFVSSSNEGDNLGDIDLPYVNVGVKYLTGNFYTMVVFGVSAEQERCIDSDSCPSDAVAMAPGFGVGGRFDVNQYLFVEGDVLYQREDLVDHEPDRGLHGIRGRAEIGVQIVSSVAVVAGGGPRLFVTDEGNTGWDPHYFAGLQFF